MHVTIGGLIDIKTANKARSHIMLALKLVTKQLQQHNNNKKGTTSSSSTVVATPAASNTYTDDDHIFYDTVMTAYDQSQMVRDYFGNDASRIRPENKKLWPLRYQAYKEYGI